MQGGGFGCAIGAAGGGTGGFPPGGCGSSFEVNVNGLLLINDVVPLGFLDGVGSTSGLAVEDSEVVCVGCREELDALVLVGGGRAGAFPFDMGGVVVSQTTSPYLIFSSPFLYLTPGHLPFRLPNLPIE